MSRVGGGRTSPLTGGGGGVLPPTQVPPVSTPTARVHTSGPIPLNVARGGSRNSLKGGGGFWARILRGGGGLGSRFVGIFIY